MYSKLLAMLCIAAIVTISFCCSTQPEQDTLTNEKPDSTTNVAKESPVKRGEYLVISIGCDDCHSPKKMGAQGPEPDMDLRLSGYPSSRPLPPIDKNALKNGWMLFVGDLTAAVGPWGVSFAANLTSDSTGIGNWTEAQFKKSLREGKYKGLDNGRPILPPMPWQNFRNLTDDDIAAIFAYLKTTKPVNNVPPAPKAPTELIEPLLKFSLDKKKNITLRTC